MRKLGDKIGAKLIAEEVGVPVAPWSRGAVDDPGRRRCAAADEIGYPLMLKATAGGGGRGIRVVASAGRPRRRVRAHQRTRRCARSAAASCSWSAWSPGARHVEVQVIADGQGTAWALGVRDCSVQRRNQKVIEESASPVLAPEQAAELKASAERLALAVGYRGAGTVEFLYHPGEKRFAFLEVNTRLQVEHPITELTTGTDLVTAAAARGRRRQAGRATARASPGTPSRPGSTPRTRTATSRPSPGRIARLVLPAGPGHPRRHRRQRGRHHPGRLRLDDRQDHRLRPRPRRGARPGCAARWPRPP